MTIRVSIGSMGASGDGIAQLPDGQVFVPFTLPGEVANVARDKNRATLIALIEASPERVEPSCIHFESCGGCSLQHWQSESYQQWKSSLVASALDGRGLDYDLAPLIPCEPESRRRVTFAARKTEAAMLLGFNRHQSHDLINISECAVAVPSITSRLDDLRKVAVHLADGAKPFKLTVTETEAGLDLAASGCPSPSDAARRILTPLMLELGFSRLSVDGEIILEPVKPLITIGKVPVNVPSGGFLQATIAAETLMAELVINHFKKVKKSADLFSGMGTFALRMAQVMAVHAVEYDAPALAALDRGIRHVQGLKPVTHERRDLFRRPILTKDLNVYQGVVFDPPRAGAEAQAMQLAKSTVKKVAAISCNPVTLARDLAILVKGGYKIDKVIPVDQFLWTSHVETVALLSKK